MPIDIKGKWALVTGASRGVGRQIALGLADVGCNVIVHSRDRAHTKSLEAELAKRGVLAGSVEGDLIDPAKVDRMLEQAIALSGGFDILYNNAAVQTPWRDPYHTAPLDDFRHSFEINVVAPIHITHRLLPRMREQKFGRIVQLTSGIRHQPELMAYAASKAALDKFVHDAAPSLRGTGVLMNLLDPGWLRTDMGGPKAPGAVESVLPGALVPVLLDGEVHGVLFHAQDYAKKKA
jgi:NAD(P)-dependent dehydrogenase (short-subunit alcohol dehydrogenase family)